MQREHDDRNAAIAKARADGQTLSEIGRRYGITRERVRQILVAMKERENDVRVAFDEAARRLGLDSNSATRAYRVMTGEHMMRVGAFDSDRMEPTPFEEIPPERWHEIPSCGDKALAVIAEVLRTSM